jgi:hypothetical protein
LRSVCGPFLARHSRGVRRTLEVLGRHRVSCESGGRCPVVHAGAGRWSPCSPPSRFPVARAAFEALACSPSSPCGDARTLLALAPLRSSADRPGRTASPSRTMRDLLSWVSPGTERSLDPSMPPHPSTDSTLSVHSHAALPAALRSCRFHLPDPVPPSWFRTTSAVSSAHGSRACCIPLPALGFVVFRAPRSRSSEDELEALTHAPRDAVPPPGGYSPPTAAPRLRGPCPPAVSTAPRLSSVVGSATPRHPCG